MKQLENKEKSRIILQIRKGKTCVQRTMITNILDYVPTNNRRIENGMKT